MVHNAEYLIQESRIHTSSFLAEGMNARDGGKVPWILEHFFSFLVHGCIHVIGFAKSCTASLTRSAETSVLRCLLVRGMVNKQLDQ